MKGNYGRNKKYSSDFHARRHHLRNNVYGTILMKFILKNRSWKENFD
jgi:hypothetical protein